MQSSLDLPSLWENLGTQEAARAWHVREVSPQWRWGQSHLFIQWSKQLPLTTKSMAAVCLGLLPAVFHLLDTERRLPAPQMHKLETNQDFLACVYAWPLLANGFMTNFNKTSAIWAWGADFWHQGPPVFSEASSPLAFQGSAHVTLKNSAAVIQGILNGPSWQQRDTDRKHVRISSYKDEETGI